MAKTLEQRWPGIVRTERRFGRPQHVVNWRKFDTPLIRRPDWQPDDLGPNEYGMSLQQVVPMPKSKKQATK
jgi:hypothetical protein